MFTGAPILTGVGVAYGWGHDAGIGVGAAMYGLLHGFKYLIDS